MRGDVLLPGVRQPDSDRFRYWEVAGASHVSLPAMASSSARMERDFGFSIPLDDDVHAGHQPGLGGARWSMPRCITCRPGCSTALPRRCSPASPSPASRPEIARDDNDIARGGIRLPQVEVPLGHNSAIQQSPDIFARLVGYHESFPEREGPCALRQP